jgi:hypothetical protein
VVILDVPSPPYSNLSATFGSTRADRNAGTKLSSTMIAGSAQSNGHDIGECDRYLRAFDAK